MHEIRGNGPENSSAHTSISIPDPMRIGLALGSGSARGWAHIGIIRALCEAGIKPHIIAGSSIGALVGAAFVCDKLDALESRVKELTWWDIVRFMDIQLRKGGFIEGQKLMGFLQRHVPDIDIEALPQPFAAVATDLSSGQEVWLRKGSLADAIRASIALPGLFTPVQLGTRWLVDGGLINPVPVSLCRALGAEFVIAVNLNGDIAGKHLVARGSKKLAAKEQTQDVSLLDKLFSQIPNGLNLKERANTFINARFTKANGAPGLFDVLAGSINIMQDHITRSRLAMNPPDLCLAPPLAHIGLLEFDRAKEAIAEGQACVERALPELRRLLG